MYSARALRTGSGGMRASPTSSKHYTRKGRAWFFRSIHCSTVLLLCSYIITILSNQGGISLKSDPKKVQSDQKRLSDFKTKVGYVLAQLDIPLSIYAATAKDKYRKPRNGMWDELLKGLELNTGQGPDLQKSFFVGDAGGRFARAGTKADHSSSDR